MPDLYKPKQYCNPEEAYSLLKEWDSLILEDERLFREKKIDRVIVLFSRKKPYQPTHAWARYMMGHDICVKGLELRCELSDKVGD